MAGGDRPELKLRLTLRGGDWLGPGKVDLLEGIAETGSISAAGRRMRMSYMRAWTLVGVMNAMFREPLVLSSRGGAEHGGAELTETGREVLALYRRLQDRAVAATEAEVAALARLAAVPRRK